MIWRERYPYEQDKPTPSGKEFDRIVEQGKFVGGQLFPKYDYKDKKKNTLDKDWEFSGAWDYNSFGILVPMEKREVIDEIQEALSKDNAMVFIGGGASDNPFDRGGLCITVRSRMPREHLDAMKKADLEQIHLEKDAKKTGIEKRLKKAGKRWFALSPKRPFVDNGDGTYTPFKSSVREETNNVTKYNVMFWLNPMEQHLYHSGWFTVEQLEEWVEDQGPVLKEEAVKN